MSVARRRHLPLLALVALLAACAKPASLSVAEGTGPQPTLPSPPERKALLPTVKIAPARGWAPGEQPLAAGGLSVQAFATGLEHPRWLHVLPNGDVLVAETNAPADRPEATAGLRGKAMQFVMKRAGAAVKSPDRITRLRDADGDGRAETREVFLDGLYSPFGMAQVGAHFYVANADALLRFDYRDGAVPRGRPGERVAALPGGARNHHWTKSLLASADGRRLYVGVGSNSNIAEHGLDAERDRAAILEIDVASGATRVYASGLRNPVGMAWEPGSGTLWTVVNERDELGSDLVPDYLTHVRDGGFYGWPWSYFGAHVDARVQPPRPDKVGEALVPDYALGPHTASLGLAHSAGNRLPPAYAEGMFVGQHGSWNREPRSGYAVIFVPFAQGKPSGRPLDVLGGFLSEAGDARGRPVGVAIAGDGALLVADDVGNVVWRVSAAAAADPAQRVPASGMETSRRPG